jgi:hypothetical protein
MKARHLVLLEEPFRLDMPYTDRQRVVVVADEQVAAERLSRARLAEERTQTPVPADSGHMPGGPADGNSYALVGQQVRRSLRGLQDVSTSLRRNFDDRAARWALRRQLGALMIGRTESSVLRFDQGHPLKNVLYVGHPAKSDLYFPAAEFHRRVFEHKFVEAVTLLTSLGARHIVVQQEQGYVMEKERTSLALGHGFTRTRNELSRSGAIFEAEFPGSRKPSLPDGLCWYADEHTWQMIARARMVNGAQKTSLAVTYTTDYGIDTRVIRAASACGVNIGGRFEEQRDTIWRLDAEFPAVD